MAAAPVPHQRLFFRTRRQCDNLTVGAFAFEHLPRDGKRGARTTDDKVAFMLVGCCQHSVRGIITIHRQQVTRLGNTQMHHRQIDFIGLGLA